MSTPIPSNEDLQLYYDEVGNFVTPPTVNELRDLVCRAFDTGHSSGYRDGLAVGYRDGLAVGYRDGLASGYIEGTWDSENIQ